MRKYLVVLFAIVGVCLLAPAAFAQATGAAAPEGTNWVAITSGFAMAIASAACGFAQGAGLRGSFGRHGAQSRRSRRDSEHVDSGAGADRVDGAVHLRHHLRQSGAISLQI